MLSLIAIISLIMCIKLILLIITLMKNNICELLMNTKCTEQIKTMDIFSMYIVIVIFIWWSPFIPSRNLDEVFTYNHIWL